VSGHVYEATNAAAGNAVQVFDRTADGRLVPTALVPTGGLGAGSSLGSQSGIARQGDLLFVVNAGDNTVSTLAITPGGLVVRGTTAAGGTRPVSVTVHGGVVYVLNHDSDTITGFLIGVGGRLVAIPDSTRPLTPNPAGGVTDAAEVAFSPDGQTLAVTEKAANTIDTFAVRAGRAGAAQSHPSAGRTPFGFEFDRRGDLLVSEAGTASASSYSLDRDGFRVVTAAVADTQAAACWLVVTGNSRYAFVMNTGSGTVSSYTASVDGHLALLKAVAGTTGAGPAEASLSPDSRTLHVRERTGALNSFTVGNDGSLTAVGVTSGAPTFGTSGLATD
jgi:6-phosphogluconolactonase (cycloisomerase 2 family)